MVDKIIKYLEKELEKEAMINFRLGIVLSPEDAQTIVDSFKQLEEENKNLNLSNRGLKEAILLTKAIRENK